MMLTDTSCFRCFLYICTGSANSTRIPDGSPVLPRKTVYFSSALQDIHNKDNDIEHQCLPFIFERMTCQKITEPLMFLLPGNPLIAQGKQWSKCSGYSGERRMRNICIGIRCASITEGTSDENDTFKSSTTHSTSLFFTNGSIFLVRTTQQGMKSTKVSKELKELAEQNISYKITSAMMFLKSKLDAHNTSVSCQKYHVFCGADQGLCIGLHEIDNEPASAPTSEPHQIQLEIATYLNVRLVLNDLSLKMPLATSTTMSSSMAL
jgi:hypothetical protein